MEFSPDINCSKYTRRPRSHASLHYSIAHCYTPYILLLLFYWLSRRHVKSATSTSSTVRIYCCLWHLKLKLCVDTKLPFVQSSATIEWQIDDRRNSVCSSIITLYENRTLIMVGGKAGFKMRIYNGERLTSENLWLGTNIIYMIWYLKLLLYMFM